MVARSFWSLCWLLEAFAWDGHAISSSLLHVSAQREQHESERSSHDEQSELQSRMMRRSLGQSMAPDGTDAEFAALGTEDPVHSETDIQAVWEKLWGTGWPPAGKSRRPTDDAEDLQGRGLKFGGLLLVLLLSAIFCIWLTTCAIHSQQDPTRNFMLHFKVLVSAIVWRHLHQRALIMHLIRIAIPSMILIATHRLKKSLETELSQETSKNVLKLLGGTTPEAAVSTILEYTLSVTMVYIVMMAMLFFVWHVAAEAQSGFRHLLHVSGLSRWAYILATAGVDGLLQAFMGILLMLFVSGIVLQVRMVLWTSEVVLFAVLLLMACSAITNGYILCFLFQRFHSSMAMFVMATVILCAPFAPFAAVVPEVGQQGWLALALPVIPAYRSSFELVAACVKGRCIAAEDVSDAFSNGRWVGPFSMIMGVHKGPDLNLTPAESLLCFWSLVLVQLAAGALLIILLDRWQYPDLQQSNVTIHEEGPPLKIENLQHSYGWSPLSTVNTLRGVSFQINSGELLGLLGPNGAGKTTAIRCITGEEAPSEGKVSIASSSGGSRIGLCPQETVINGDLTVMENLLFFALVRGASGEKAAEHVEAIISATRLREKRDALPDELSGGMRRRLAVGCAMVATPDVVILDEPTTGLDPVSRRGIWETISEVKQAGGCCLLTTHMLEEAEYLASHIVVLCKGVVAAQGSVQHLKQEWGTGYMLSVESEMDKEEEASEFIKSLLSENDQQPVNSTRHGQATYKFSKDDEALGHLIISIARGKDKKCIRHWGVSQASLEDAYVRIIQQS
eukprot:TRINITY_DN36600_c0_g1_i1.p1 TRINITY_DN36600_c0_g1~~TRINITY_DN36600_c0_g1_i1.p1  ORF type:complete len:790 (+),score=146.25 TRINITY_DN36600_c0_g1_i1:116-2485(+)